MITKELIDRINFLARKKRYEGLTEAEAAEQKEVREIYLQTMRQRVRATLESVKLVDEEPEHNHGCDCGKCN